MVTFGTNELVSSSDLSKKFGSYLSQIKEHTVEKLAVLKNNRVEAVLVSTEEFERMNEALKYVEAQKIIGSINNGLEDVKTGRTKSIENLWNELDD